MLKSSIVAIVASTLLLSGSAANAQAPAPTCAGKDETVCKAAGYCTWRSPKAVNLPTGATYQPASSCAFKPNVKKGLAATAAK